MNYFKQKLPNNSCIGFPSALCSNLADGRFAAVETVTHLLQGSSELERPGCLLLRTFLWVSPVMLLDHKWMMVTSVCSSLPDSHCACWGGRCSGWTTRHLEQDGTPVLRVPACSGYHISLLMGLKEVKLVQLISPRESSY